MRHAIAGNRLSRNQSLRKATVRDLAKATLIQQRILTTKAKAKEARKLIDRLITLGKKGTLAHKRRAFAILCDHNLVSDLFGKIAKRFGQRQGGYTRIIPFSIRRGDNAHMVYLELTEKDELIISHAKAAATAQRVPAAETKGPAPAADKPAKVEKGEAPKAHPKKEIPGREKKTKMPKLMGGIQKMFHRKTGES